MNVCILWMLYFDIFKQRSVVKEGLMLVKQVHQKSMMFAIIGFKFQGNFWNRRHDLLTISMNLSDIAILSIKGVNYHCIISEISKNEAMNLMQNADLTEKSRTL